MIAAPRLVGSIVHSTFDDYMYPLMYLAQATNIFLY